MAAAERRRPARSLARALLSVTVVVVAVGCTPGSTADDAEPLYAGATTDAGAGRATATDPEATAAPTPGATAGATGGATATAAPLSSPAYEGDAATGLSLPWSVVVLENGELLVSERETGEIKQLGGGTASVIGTVPDAAAAGGEGGLLGLAVQPGAAPDAVYAYYTSDGDNRVVRLPWEDGQLGAPEPILTGIPKADIHNGGRIAFGPDGHLYIGTGDAAVRADAQDPASLGGKILRVTPEGAVPEDNPTPGSPVYSLGHRNVQGLAWDAAGRLWATEFGPEVDDELNLVQPGGNYGWPDVTGAPADPRFIDAQVVWPSTASSSPSGMAIVGDVAYIGGLRGQRLWQVPLVEGVAGRPVSHFDGSYGRLRDVAMAADGSLVVATNEQSGARLLRITLQ